MKFDHPPSYPPDLDGYLHLVPFAGADLITYSAGAFGDLIERHSTDEVLVLKRSPTGQDYIESVLQEYWDGSRPRVFGLAGHARRVLERLPETPRILDPIEQRQLLSAYLEEYDWEVDYLQRASNKESFKSDVGRFVTEATWQGLDIDTEDPVLGELAKFTREFHQWLDRQSYLDPAAVLLAAIEALADQDNRKRVQRGFEAVLVLEFEEFASVDRRYLASLSKGIPLKCVAERDSSIQRTWNEGGRIETKTTSLDVKDISAEQTLTGIGSIAAYLATGVAPTQVGTDDVVVLESETFEDQVRAVADEIERLRRETGVAYQDCAVLLPTSNSPIPETLRQLQNAGIPVTSATVSGLEHDPSARELYAVASWFAREDKHTEAGWSEDRALKVLRGRVDDFDRKCLREIAERYDGDIQRSIFDWCIESGLKSRIASEEDPLDAKIQFSNVKTILEIASFIVESPLLKSSWVEFCTALEQEMERANTDVISTDVSLPGEGVLVDAIRVLKNEPKEVVFLLNVVDRDYPSEPLINRLFPSPHLESLIAYPSYTTPSAEDVRETFSTGGELSARPFKAYHAELSRRLLAIGSRTPENRLYLATYRDESGSTGSKLQPSRYLAAIEREFGSLPRPPTEDINSYGRAIEFALNVFDDTLVDIRRAGTIGEPVDLSRVADEFGGIQAILAWSPPEELRESIRAKLEFAKGAVRRE